MLSLLAELKTTKQIATELGVSPRTIDNHRAHICVKLDLQGPHALTKFALTLGGRSAGPDSLEHKRSER